MFVFPQVYLKNILTNHDTHLAKNIFQTRSFISDELLFTLFSVTQPKFIPDCLRQWEFGLYVSGFWHIYAKTPRGIVICEQ